MVHEPADFLPTVTDEATSALEFVGEVGEISLGIVTLYTVGALAADLGEPGRAAKLLGAASAACDRVGHEPPPLLWSSNARVRRDAEKELVQRTRAILGQDAFSRAWVSGQAMMFVDAIQFALRWTRRLKRELDLEDTTSTASGGFE
jgi:hypothetical protein